MINAFLVRWFGGWAEVRDDAAIAASGRTEALLGLGAVQSVAEVDRVARKQLAVYADVRTQIRAGLAPRDEADTPYLSFLVGDTVLVPDETGTATRERVIALTVAQDDATGDITFAPELKDVLLSQAERAEQTLKKMADGTVRGDSKVATPASQVAISTPKDCCPPLPPIGGG